MTAADTYLVISHVTDLFSNDIMYMKHVVNHTNGSSAYYSFYPTFMKYLLSSLVPSPTFPLRIPNDRAGVRMADGLGKAERM